MQCNRAREQGIFCNGHDPIPVPSVSRILCRAGLANHGISTGVNDPNFTMILRSGPR